MQESEKRQIQTYSDMVMRICLQRLGRFGREEAEDAYQNVFLTYIRTKPCFRDSEHERHWFARCALDRCRDAARRLARERSRLTGMPDEEPSAETLPDAGHLDVIMAVSRLDPRYAEPVMLCWGEGMSGEEAAKVLGITHAALRKRLSRAGAMLRDMLGGE